jgi:signal transduction histidine kinase
VEHAALFIAQEALTNIAKHSNAAVVQVSLQLEGKKLHLRVEDDGSAVPGSTRVKSYGSGLGQLGMKSRAESCGGSVEVAAGSPHGMLISAVLPFA